MIFVSLTVAVIAAIVAWRGTAVQALCVYVASLLWYPEFVSIPVGSLDFTVGRILVLVCLIKVLIQRVDLDAFRLRRFDLLVLLVVAAKIFSVATHEPLGRTLEAESGNLCNTVLPYFLVRITISSRERLHVFLRALGIIAAPLAVLGCIQCTTGFNPFAFMQAYSAWNSEARGGALRWGLSRATVTFDQYIAFGLFFAAVLPLALARSTPAEAKWSKIVIVVLLIAGALSSMSTAPLLSLAVSGAFLALYPFRKYSAVVVLVLAATIVVMEVASDRHFYEVMSRFAMDSSTAYDRVGLYKEALGGGMNGHWIFGFGFVGLGAGNTNTYFAWEYKDFTSFYIEHLAKFGLIVVAPLLLVNAGYYILLHRTFKKFRSGADRWTLWCVAATLLGWNLAMLTVTTVSVLPQLLYMFIGLAASLDRAFRPELVPSGRASRTTRDVTRKPVLVGERG